MNVYVWTNTMKNAYIWEYIPRQPWANTLAYYPLTSSTTTSDMKWSWTAYNLTNNWVSFGTYAGVSCAYFPNSTAWSDTNYWLYTTAFWMSTDMTVSLRFYQISFPNTHSCQFQFWTGTRNYVLWTWINSSWDVCLWAWQSANESIVIWKGTYQWEWHYMTVTKSWTNFTLFIDKEQITTLSFSNAVPQRFNLWAQPVDRSDLYGYLSEVIVETVAWDADRISDYYNYTKANYWL